ncbi:hypothetical protein BY996DRAFT_6413326 [Phakopsora pachyrhizi]|nr:hypothetical protein BY996DRAFT_6413326 [Phakopsora pachyrhizi]
MSWDWFAQCRKLHRAILELRQKAFYSMRINWMEIILFLAVFSKRFALGFYKYVKEILTYQPEKDDQAFKDQNSILLSQKTFKDWLSTDASNKKLEPQISKTSTINKEPNGKKGSNPQPVSTSLNDPLPNRETIREVRNCGAYPLKIPVNETEGFNSQPVSTCLNDPRHMTQAINPFANEPVLYSRQLN